jgi:SAM-dependent methyltransferase
MTTHGLRGFLNRSYPMAAGLAALTAALDAKAGDVALEPALDARLYPSLRIVGIDVFEPALRLARENVARAGVGDRVTLRAQGAEQLDDDRAFDLAWIPSLFMPEPILPAAVERTHRALRPGGWLVFVTTNVDGRDPLQAAFWRFTTTMFGGPCWSAAEGEALLRAHGFSDVRALPAPPGTPAAFVVGRRAAAA